MTREQMRSRGERMVRLEARIPESVKRALEERAARNRRSVTAELVVILEAATREQI
jgi:plasmid stability protein